MDESKSYYIKDEMSQSIIQTARKIAERDGAKQITVRKILEELNISNRVFYNRFRNLDEVMDHIYQNLTDSFRISIQLDYKTADEYYEAISQLPVQILEEYYEKTSGMEQYIFEQDSINMSNLNWWQDNMMEILQYGVDKGYLKKVDVQAISYIIWCFIRSFFADVVTRQIPFENAEAIFNEAFSIFLNGIKPSNK